MNCIARFAKVAVCGVLLLLGAGSAQALIIHGDNFDIVAPNVAAFGLYNEPSIVGSAIRFSPDPNIFKADALNGASASIGSSAIFDIVAHTGFQLDSLFLVERGNYLLNGPNSAVNHSGKLIVIDPNDTTFFEEINENILPLAPLTINDNAQHRWDGRATADILNSLIAGAGTLSVTINNLLTANADQINSPSQAFIDKSFATAPVTLGVNEFPADPVPLPAAVWLFGSGLIGLFGVARQRSWKS